MLLMIGWRGEPGLKDEPQHVKQGAVTLEMLDTMGIPYAILPDTDNEARAVLEKMKVKAQELQQPVALVVRKNTFASYDKQTKDDGCSQLTLKREEALEIVLDEIADDDVVVFQMNI